MSGLHLPPVIRRALDLGAPLVISISAGKDGQAMLMALVQAYYRHGWTGPIYALHMDLGRAEWRESLGHCERIAAIAGVELVVRRRPQGDLFQEIEDRMTKLAGTGKPFWPSANERYCTSDQKRGQADKELRAPAPFWPSQKNRYCTGHHKTNQADKELRRYDLVISAEGIRGGESDARSGKQPVSVRKQITCKWILDQARTPDEALFWYEERPFWAAAPKDGRLALTWFPIFEWTEAEVYRQCGHSIEERNERREMYRQGRKEEALADWWMHPAYVYGNDRVSCVICILGSMNDLRTGARERPDLLDYLIRLEQAGGATFKHNWSLERLREQETQPKLF